MRIRDTVNSRINALREEQKVLRQKQERKRTSQNTRALLRYALSELPTASSDLEARIVFVTDGRRSGQTAGNGSGCIAICAKETGSSTYNWLRTDDYSVVVN